MTKFKVKVFYPDGSSDIDDFEFDTYIEAQDHFSEIENNYRTGGEVLHMSNPGDYPEEYDELSFEVIEIDD